MSLSNAKSIDMRAKYSLDKYKSKCHLRSPKIFFHKHIYLKRRFCNTEMY